MITFFNRPATEQEIIRKAYDFEIESIELNSSAPNPYMQAINEMGLREALEEALEMAYHH